MEEKHRAVLRLHPNAISKNDLVWFDLDTQEYVKNDLGGIVPYVCPVCGHGLMTHVPSSLDNLIKCDECGYAESDAETPFQIDLNVINSEFAAKLKEALRTNKFGEIIEDLERQWNDPTVDYAADACDLWEDFWETEFKEEPEPTALACSDLPTKEEIAVLDEIAEEREDPMGAIGKAAVRAAREIHHALAENPFGESADVFLTVLGELERIHRISRR